MKTPRTILGILQLFVGIGGIGGGIGLLSDPTGGNIGMPMEFLETTPFSDFLIPGLVLFAVNGVGQLVGGVMTLAAKRRYPEVATAFGVFLMVWIVAQVWWIGLLHWLQPLYFCLGGIELMLVRRARR